MALDLLKLNDAVLIVWGTSSPPSNLQETVQSVKDKVGSKGIVQVENEAMLLNSGHSSSMFDVAFSGLTDCFYHSEQLLKELLKVIKPKGSVVFKQVIESKTFDEIKSALILTGFTNVNKIFSDEKTVEINCQKPNFEVGKTSRLPISFAKKNRKTDVEKVWTLSALDMNDDNVGIIDSDSLLDANDLVRPDLSAIKTDCGTSKNGKRKACKGCSCGLAEELETGVAPTQKSACGSCYLGDAFRCASCPYLGMPPFKPGQQVTLSDRQLKPDLY